MTKWELQEIDIGKKTLTHYFVLHAGFISSVSDLVEVGHAPNDGAEDGAEAFSDKWMLKGLIFFLTRCEVQVTNQQSII